jgi:5-oxoprolinase (ATP-hydrolysing) subunit C
VKPALRILDSGWVTTYQDLGRHGVEKLGIPVSGAADQYSAAAANVLVGNDRGATLLEITGAQFAAIAECDLLISATGATARIAIDDRRVPMWSPVCVQSGSVITVTDIRDGIRLYLAVNGQLDADRFLGSSAPDARMGFAQRIHRGSIVHVHTDYEDFTHPYSDIPLLQPKVPVPNLRPEIWTIDVTDGPETHAIDGIRNLIESSTYVVGPQSDHVGLRLDGPVAHPKNLPEVTSHGIPIGAVEVPHSDELIILGRARSLTAGYPIVAIATRSSLSRLGQAGPGRRLRLRWTTVESAVESYLAQEDILHELEQSVASIFGAVGIPTLLGAPN